MPGELRAVLASRQHDNARVEWVSTFYYEVIAPGHGQRLTAAGIDPTGHLAVERYHSSKFAGPDHLFINHGDAEGCQEPHRKGQAFAYFNHTILDRGHNAWSWRDCVARVESRNACPTPETVTPNDVRLLGLFPEPTERATFDRFLRIEDNAVAGSWSVSEGGTLKTVTCAVAVPGGTRQEYGWVVDTAKDNNCIHAWRKDAGTVAVAAVTELENYNGQWFPRRVMHYKDGEVAAEMDVFHAEFGTLTQTEIPLSEMGFPAGFGLNRVDSEGSQYVFDGERFVSTRDFARRARAGELSTAESRALIDEFEECGYGQRPRQGALRQFASSQVAPAPGLWEPYVRWFIRKHKLPAPAMAKAREILRQCRAQANGFLESREKDLARLDPKTNELRQESASDLRIDQIAELTEARAKMLRPIEKVFHKQLKPGLEALVRQGREPVEGSGGAKRGSVSRGSN
jgi:hypothetical protein